VVQGLDVSVATRGGREDFRRAAALDGPAGDVERGNGRAQLAIVRITDGPLDQ
jgi:hypothetical protein